MADRTLHLLERLFLEIDQKQVMAEVEALRKQHPAATTEDLAQELTRRAARKAAITGIGAGAAGGPLGVLAMAPDIFNLVRLQSRLVLSIAFLHGREAHIRERFREVLATLAISTGAAASRQTARYLLQRGLEAELAKKIVRRIVGKQAAKRLTAAAPVLGGIAGGVLNYAAVKAAGRAATAFYARGEKQIAEE